LPPKKSPASVLRTDSFFAPQRPIRINFFNLTPVAKAKCQRYVNVLSTIRSATPSWDQSGRGSVREWRRQFPIPGQQRRYHQENSRTATRSLAPTIAPPQFPCDYEREAGGDPAAETGNLRREDDAQNVPAGRFGCDANSEFAGSLQNGVRDDAVVSGGCPRAKPAKAARNPRG